jgi:hypothetical protein
MIDLFNHFALIFPCWPIFMIKMVITHRWRFINYRLPMSNIILTKITRRRHIWIMIPWRTKIMHNKKRFPWHRHWWSIWRKRHWFVRVTPLSILIMELISRRSFGRLEFLDRLAPLTLFCLWDLAGSFSLGFGFSLRCLRPLDSMVIKTPISGFLGLTIFGLDLLCIRLGEAVRPGCPSVRPASVQLVASPLFCCPPERQSTRCILYALARVFWVNNFG